MIKSRKFQLLSVRFHPDFMFDTRMFNPLMEKSVDRKRILKHELLGKIIYAKYVIYCLTLYFSVDILWTLHLSRR